MTRKVTHVVAAIKLGLAEEPALGNLDAEHDWGKPVYLMVDADLELLAAGVPHRQAG